MSTRSSVWPSPRSSVWSRARGCSGSSARSWSRTRSSRRRRGSRGRGPPGAARDCSSWPELARSPRPLVQSSSCSSAMEAVRQSRREGDRGRQRRRAGSEDRRAPGDHPPRDVAHEHRRRGRERLGARRRGQDRLADRSEGARPRADVQHGLDADRPRCRRGRALDRKRRVARSGPRSRRACPGSIRSRTSSTGRSPCPGQAARPPPGLAGQPETAHRGDGRRGLGGQSRSERLPDRPADEPGRGRGRRRPCVEHRCGRGRSVGRQRPRGGRRDRSTDERRLEADPGRRRQPDGARRRRRRGLGR